MLDILRRHASSWVIKVILGAIVISFIFFFGYSSMRGGGRPGTGAVATVNGQPISAAEYRFLLEQNYERFRAGFEGQEVPDFVRRIAASTTMGQLVSRRLVMSLADDMGIVVTDAELLDAIRQTPAAQRDGEFDAVFYRTGYLPYFKQRFGIDYERFLEQDLKIEALQETFSGFRESVMFAEGPGADERTWTFDTVALDPERLRDSHESMAEVRSFAKLLLASDPARWNDMLRPFEIEVQRTLPLGIRDRSSLLDGQGELEDHMAVFSLTEESPVLEKPIERGAKIYIVRLVSISEPEDPRTPWIAGDLFNSWMQKVRESARITSFLDEEE